MMPTHTLKNTFLNRFLLCVIKSDFYDHMHLLRPKTEIVQRHLLLWRDENVKFCGEKKKNQKQQSNNCGEKQFFEKSTKKIGLRIWKLNTARATHPYSMRVYYLRAISVSVSADSFNFHQVWDFARNVDLRNSRWRMILVKWAFEMKTKK